MLGWPEPRRPISKNQPPRRVHRALADSSKVHTSRGSWNTWPYSHPPASLCVSVSVCVCVCVCVQSPGQKGCQSQDNEAPPRWEADINHLILTPPVSTGWIKSKARQLGRIYSPDPADRFALALLVWARVCLCVCAQPAAATHYYAYSYRRARHTHTHTHTGRVHVLCRVPGATTVCVCIPTNIQRPTRLYSRFGTIRLTSRMDNVERYHIHC